MKEQLQIKTALLGLYEVIDTIGEALFQKLKTALLEYDLNL